jgi:RNA polymerase sigma-70 factor (ECF subfamily)
MSLPFSIDQIPQIKLIISLQSDNTHAEIAFKIVYTGYRDSLYKEAYDFLKDEEEAKEVVQETFIALWNSRHHLIIPDNNLKNFLIHTVENRCTDILRKRKSKEKFIDYINSTFRTFNHINPPEKKELASYMQQVVLALPEKRLEIFILQYIYEIIARYF